jgi:hypothetical protein
MGSAFSAVSFTNSLKNLGGTDNDGGPDDSSEEINTDANITAAGLRTSFIWGGGDGTPNAGGTTAWERIEFSAAGGTWGLGRASDDGRNYLTTVGTDYQTASFTSEVLFTTSASGNGAQAFFMGMGTGQRGSYNTPDIGTDNTSVFLEARDGGIVKVFTTRVSGDGFGNKDDYGSSFSWTAGTHRAVFSYDAATSAATFRIDLGNDGSFDGVSMPVDVSALVPDWNGGEDARLYIGGDDGIVLSDWTTTVVPESSTPMLLALGGLLLLVRRRD